MHRYLAFSRFASGPVLAEDPVIASWADVRAVGVEGGKTMFASGRILTQSVLNLARGRGPWGAPGVPTSQSIFSTEFYSLL